MLDTDSSVLGRHGGDLGGMRSFLTFNLNHVHSPIRELLYHESKYRGGGDLVENYFKSNSLFPQIYITTVRRVSNRKNLNLVG